MNFHSDKKKFIGHDFIITIVFIKYHTPRFDIPIFVQGKSLKKIYIQCSNLLSNWESFWIRGIFLCLLGRCIDLYITLLKHKIHMFKNLFIFGVVGWYMSHLQLLVAKARHWCYSLIAVMVALKIFESFISLNLTKVNQL